MGTLIALRERTMHTHRLTPRLPSAPHTLRVALEPPERARYWARALDASEDELRQVVSEVGPRACRVCARLWELRQAAPGAGYPADGVRMLREPDCATPVVHRG